MENLGKEIFNKGNKKNRENIKNRKNREKFRESYLFPIDINTMVDGEKNKLIKLFLNILDVKFNNLVVFNDSDKDKIKKELRSIFLDIINGFSRFTKTTLINYVSHAENLDIILDSLRSIEEDISNLDYRLFNDVQKKR